MRLEDIFRELPWIRQVIQINSTCDEAIVPGSSERDGGQDGKRRRPAGPVSSTASIPDAAAAAALAVPDDFHE